MNRKVLTEYGILKKYDVKGDEYEWADRTTFVVDKEGIIRHIEQGSTAINPNTATSICVDLNKKSGG
jgi:peroxiredoxin